MYLLGTNALGYVAAASMTTEKKFYSVDVRSNTLRRTGGKKFFTLNTFLKSLLKPVQMNTAAGCPPHPHRFIDIDEYRFFFASQQKYSTL
jgi:hypothetical protein